MKSLKNIGFITIVIISFIASCAISPFPELKSDLLSNTPVTKSSNLNTDQKLSELDNTINQTPTVVYLPTVQKEFPLQTVFGVQMNRIASDAEFDLVTQLGISWTRKDLFWTQIEPKEGEYNWSSLHEFEQDLIKNSSKFVNVILVINKTPEWARKYPNSECGPIKSEKFEAFGNFIAKVVNRYSAPPFNIQYYEIWNEPDIDPALFNFSGNSIGCWGDNNDSFYGGGYYAEMLKVVYPKLKSANPNAKLLIGGLLLDCDPRGNPSPCQLTNKNPKPANFLEGILKNNGKEYFDGVSFHSYDYYDGSLGKYAFPNWNSSWNTTGPSLFAKVNFLNEVLGRYNANAKFLINTEAAVLCDSCSDDSDFELTKAYYIPKLYSVGIAAGLRANLWYSSTGWRNSGLITSNGTPKQPAYQAYQYAREIFLNAKFSRELSLGENIKGMEFYRDNILLWIVWSKDGNPHSITLPDNPIKIISALGNSLQPSQIIEVTIEPVYVEFSR